MSEDPRTTFFVAPLKQDKCEIIRGARVQQVKATSFTDAARQVGITAEPLGISCQPSVLDKDAWKPVAELLKVW